MMCQERQAHMQMPAAPNLMLLKSKWIGHNQQTNLEQISRQSAWLGFLL